MKPERTADCVVVGAALEVEAGPHRDPPPRPLRRRRRDRLRRLRRRRRGPPRDDRGAGAAAARGGARPALLGAEPLGRRAGSRSSRVRPELVVEVRYDKVQGNRFRHGTKLLRFRPDKDPEVVHVGGGAAAAGTGRADGGRVAGSPGVRLRPDTPALLPVLLRARRLHARRLARHLREVRRVRAPRRRPPPRRARPTRAARGGRTRCRRSPPARRRARRSAPASSTSVKSSVSTSGSSSQVTGADTVASGRARTE